MGLNPICDLFARLHIGVLHIDRADAELLVSEASLVMRRHVVFDKISVAFDPTDQIGLIPPDVEIAMPDLAVIVGADRIVSLADVHHHMHVLGKSLQAHIDNIDGSADFVVRCRCEIRLVYLQMLTTRRSKSLEVLMEELAEIIHHPDRVEIVFIVCDRSEKVRARHGDLHGLPCNGRD